MRVMVVSCKNRHDITLNCQLIEQITKKVYQDVDLLVFPEAMLTGYPRGELEVYIEEDDPRIRSLQAMSKTYDLGISVGAVVKRGQHFYNGNFCFFDQSHLYLKTHLGKREETLFEPGHDLAVYSFRGHKVGVALCLESHIPDVIQTYRLRGAEVILMPFASPKKSGDRLKLWRKYLPTRAYDNGLFILAVNALDDYYSGGAAVLDPKGTYLLETYETMAECLINLDSVQAIQEETYKCNYISRRRSELYERG